VPGRSHAPLRLHTASGTVRPRLPSVPTTTAERKPPAPATFVRDALDERWEKLRQRLRKGLPHQPRKIDEAVRELRTTSRKLLALLATAERIGAGKPARRLARRVDDLAGRLGTLRDLAVQREQSSRLRAPASRRALKRFDERVEGDLRRAARKLRRRLRRADLEAWRHDQRRVSRRLRKRAQADDDAVVRREVVKVVRASFSELRARRRVVDPTRSETLHQMRTSLKSFRYLTKALKPLVPGVSKDALETLHALQTNLGDLHDLEVVSASLAAFAKDEPSQAPEVASVLAELEARHSRMLQSFLKSADVILDHWQRALAAAWRATPRPR
jgi:CHAD domain-containing protein